MSMNWRIFLFGAAIAALVLGATIFGTVAGRNSIANDCTAMGTFRMDEAVFICARRGVK